MWLERLAEAKVSILVKSLLASLSVAAACLCPAAFADDAPASVAGKSAVVVISSGTGAWAPFGGYRIAFAAIDNSYSVSPLGGNTAGSSGTYTYTKTAANTATLNVTDKSAGATASMAMTFTSPTTATYTLTGGGSQRATIVFENLTQQVAASGLINISTRILLGPGATATPGFVLETPARVLIRAAGPSLSKFGVSNCLADPRFSVAPLGGATIASNDDWAGDPKVSAASTASGAFGLISPESKDAALVLDLPAGGYTCSVTSSDGGSGEVILEVYRVPN